MTLNKYHRIYLILNQRKGIFIKHKRIEEETEISVLKKTSLIAIVAVILTTILTSSAQIFWKMGTNSMVPGDWMTIILNPYILGGFVLYGIGAIVMIVALKRGELSVLFPIIALSYVWVALAAHYYFEGDSMNVIKWAGIAAIVFGVSLIGIGSQMAERKKAKTEKARAVSESAESDL